MEKRQLPGLGWSCSPVSLGGGGIGAVWGPTSRDEAICTVRDAIFKHGINHLDMAPIYGKDREAERLIGLAFEGDLPKHVYVTTKCYLGNRAVDDVYSYLSRSLDLSLIHISEPTRPY
eukprot:TRINITY_DN31366_c0_g1_i1.p1 TRINITY_DN31366_c0_g1~~TRINITY_DN31366_c0_g1_i1.p1  ORF type:complete len:118 (-),score=10.73 TRINITY_DN31366_c0_g1_i1:51-404(-)